MMGRWVNWIVGAIVMVGAALGLIWLAGGSADVAPRSQPDSAVVGSRDSARSGGAGGSDARDSSADGASYDHPVPSPSPPDSTTNVTPPNARGSDPVMLPGPLTDSSIAAVERDLDDRALAIPVQGVRADQLVDTYTASRSEGRVHNAIDIMAAGGTPVVAAAAGTVVKLFNSEKGGITLYQLDPDGRTVYYYAHLAGYAPGIAVGTTLARGQILGYVGDTGNAGPGNTHLHFEITITEGAGRYWSGTPVNPFPLLRRAR